MRFRAFGDIMGNASLISHPVGSNLFKVEFIIFTGDIPDAGVFKIVRKQKVLGGEANQAELKQNIETDELLEGVSKQLRNVEASFKELRQKRDIYCVFGNADLRKLINQTAIEETVKNLHGSVVPIDDWLLVGYEGRPLYILEDQNADERAFSEETIAAELSAILDQLDCTRVVLVTHSPPHRILDQVVSDYREYALATYGDSAKEGHIGSLGLRDVVSQYEPRLHIFGHIHEGRGVRIEGGTTFVNVGSLGESQSYVDISMKENHIDLFFLNS